jgi:hypothetical protein
MSEQITEWRKGVLDALKKNGFSETNNTALGMAAAMKRGEPEETLTYAQGVEVGEEVAKRCKYGKR